MDGEDIERIVTTSASHAPLGALKDTPSDNAGSLVRIVEPRINSGEKLKVYAEVNSWSGMSLGAFIKDLKFSLRHLNDFEQEAIVSDHKWLEALVALGNTLFSGI
ncbi:MAG: STAS/SEC14 domain-containing protein [Cyanobacteria bacterium J06629_2]